MIGECIDLLKHLMRSVGESWYLNDRDLQGVFVNGILIVGELDVVDRFCRLSGEVVFSRALWGEL